MGDFATYNQLVYPPDNYSWDRFIDIHGISPSDTKFPPIFPDVWEEIKYFIEGQNILSHNGAFEFSVLNKTLDYYGMETAQFKQHSTYKIYKKKLNILCAEHGIQLKHHDALNDAKAFAELFKMHLNLD
jgi:DNA polymerase-3 subunit epsilon